MALAFLVDIGTYRVEEVAFPYLAYQVASLEDHRLRVLDMQMNPWTEEEEGVCLL